jgi:hypothetical protein
MATAPMNVSRKYCSVKGLNRIGDVNEEKLKKWNCPQRKKVEEIIFCL